MVVAPQMKTQDFQDDSGEWKRKTIIGPDGKPEKTGKTILITAFAGGSGMPEPTYDVIPGHPIFPDTEEGRKNLENSINYWKEHALATET
jgi:hypothetical protein